MSWLTNADLVRALEKYEDVRVWSAFRGIYPNDALPQTPMKPPVFIILNTDPHNLLGRHWKVIYMDETHCGEVFDSLATPLSNHVIQFMNRHTRKWKTNQRMFQHPSSRQCGVYVLYFITQRLNYPSLHAFCQTFSMKLSENERMMRQFYRQL